MSRMADYALWLEETGRADAEESQRAYVAELRASAAHELAEEFGTDESEWTV